MRFVEAHKTDYELIDADYANIFAAIDMAKRHSFSKPLALTYKAALDVDMGDNTRAEASLLEAHKLERARTPNDPHRIAGICHMLGEVLRLSDAFEPAGRYYTEGLAISREVGIQSLIADLLVKRVRVNLHKQDPAEALAEIKEGMDLAQSLGMPSMVADGHISMGLVKRQQGVYGEASGCFAEALQISCTMQYPLDTCECLENLVAVYVADGQLACAQETLIEFSQAAQPLNNTLVSAKLHMATARLAAANGDFAQVRREGEAGIALFEAVGHQAKAETARRWLALLDGSGLRVAVGPTA